MLSQSRSLEFLIVQSISYSKRYSTFWACLDHNKKYHCLGKPKRLPGFQLRVFHFEYGTKSKTQSWKTSDFDHNAPRFSTPPSFPV